MLILSLLGVLHLLTAPVISLRQPSDDYWGEYGPYGECSRTCGNGVAMRSRVCNTMRTDGGHNCVGPSKSYKICNTQECPSGSRDFREEQCSQFDRMDFQGKRYTWQPYYGGTNPCELVCVPRGENFYYRHRPAVMDGTPCYVGRNDICVEGVCRALTQGEIVGFDHAPSTPAHRVPRPGVTHTTEQYRYSFSTYSECTVPCGGGTQTRSVNCMLDGNVVDDSHCVGLGLERPPAQRACNQHACAEYSVSSYSTCSVTCGEGQQVREVFCVGSRGERLPEHHCSGLSRPVDIRTCRKPACHQVFRYYVNDWSLCTRSCGTGSRERRVVCMDLDLNEYGDDRCSPQSKPHAIENCNTQACPGAQLVPSVQDPRGHESTLRGFVPYGHGEPSVHRPYEPYTPVVGPHCAQSYYGCCPDGHTAATGPRGEGCASDDCIRSRYGCCLDGVTPAQGFGRAGCMDYIHRDYPSVRADVCSLSRDVGPCYEWKSRFYFDGSTHNCTHFWYGGCLGNANNFASEDECRRTCGASAGDPAPPPPPPPPPTYREPAVRRILRGRPYRARA